MFSRMLSNELKGAMKSHKMIVLSSYAVSFLVFSEKRRRLVAQWFDPSVNTFRVPPIFQPICILNFLAGRQMICLEYLCESLKTPQIRATLEPVALIQHFFL